MPKNSRTCNCRAYKFPHRRGRACRAIEAEDDYAATGPSLAQEDAKTRRAMDRNEAEGINYLNSLKR